MPDIRRLGRLLLVLLAFALASPAPTLAQSTGAAGGVTVVSIDNADTLFLRWEQQAATIEKRLQEEEITTEVLASIRETLDPQRVNARTLAAQARDQLAPLLAQLDSLGPAPAEGETESAEVKSERDDLNRRIATLRGVVSKADLAFTRADRLIDVASAAQRARFTDALLQQGPAPIDPRHWLTAGTRLAAVTAEAVTEATSGEAAERRREVWRDSGLTAIAALTFAFVMLVVVRRYAMRRLFLAIRPTGRAEAVAETDASPEAAAITPAADGQGPRPGRVRRLLIGTGMALTRLIMPIAAILAARYALRLLDVLGPTGRVLMDGVFTGLAFIVVASALISTLFSPRIPELRLSDMADATARQTAFYTMVVAIALAFNIGLVGAGEALDMPAAALAVYNLVTVLLASWGLWRVAGVWSGRRRAPVVAVEGEEAPQADENWLTENLVRGLRRGAYLLAVVTPLAAVAGYYALSRYILQSGILSAVVIGGVVILFLIANEASQALYEAGRENREAKGEADRGEAGVGLFPVFIGFVLCLAAIPVLALVWGATTGDLREAYFGITQGFSIGETRFRPGDLLIAALVFGFGLFLTRLLQAIMRRAVMPRTKLDVGARSSIVSGLGYLGFFVAALSAISIGGIDLTNLAFLGAALGVGIGFGLQNIVNNFVSGIILLIERPIKVGDWIEVASTHGTVRKINVRSTEIKTFDKASYIVPNSELISGAVTNYTHEDVMGRVICPVGVAYGTDVRLVERILLEIARAHPMVLRRPPPAVIFQGFGASSLDFELRAFLRDVNWVLATRSDVNFEIERRFAEENIEVPFGQTDVTVKNAGEMIELMSRAAAHAPRPAPTDEEGKTA